MVRHSHFGLVAGLSAVSGGRWFMSRSRYSCSGRGGFGGPDCIQDGQVVASIRARLPGLGRGALLAVSVQHAGQ